MILWRLLNISISGFLIFTFFSTGWSSDYWKILSPLPGSNVKNGELFIVASPKIFPLTSIIMFLDNTDVTADAKVDSCQISLLYLQHLAPGRHTITIVAKDSSDNYLPPLTWSFNVHDEDKQYEVKGNLELTNSSEAINGPGAFLRQQPAKISTIDLNLKLTHKSVSYPVRLYLTSEDSPYYQSRNRIWLGVKSKIGNLFWGDNTPYLERLILSGARIRGIFCQLKLWGINLDFIHGELQRGVEGELNHYSPEMGFPPPNIQQDSTYVIPGTYRRKGTALRLVLGSNSNFRVAFSGLKVKDDTASIKYGKNPRENLVLGSDVMLNLFKDRWNIKSGLAISITTNNIAPGPATKAEIDSLLNINFPFDPAQFDNIIIVNRSTIPLTVDNFPSLAWYVESHIKLTAHKISAGYKSIGPAYISLGNPFLRNDRKGFLFNDRFSLFNRRVNVILKFQKYQQELLANSFVTINTTPAYPRLHFSYNMYQRGEDLTTSFSTASYYNIQQHDFYLQLSLLKRTGFEGLTAQTIATGFTEHFSRALTFNLQYSAMKIKSFNNQMLNSFYCSLNYRLLAERLILILLLKNSAITNTNRLTFQLKATYNFSKSVYLQVESGYLSYRAQYNSQQSYRGKFFVIRNGYRF